MFADLRRRIGLQPEAILAASDALLISVVKPGGMLPDRRAEKLRECARLAVELGVKRLRETARRSIEARKLFKRFPGIGEPGADKLLLFSRAKLGLAPDSNVLRVLLRLGYGDEGRSYGASYRSATSAVAAELPRNFDWAIRAHLLLRRHGQELCKHNAPYCDACPLADGCRYRR